LREKWIPACAGMTSQYFEDCGVSRLGGFAALAITDIKIWHLAKMGYILNRDSV
jgi:hypothetical protein